MRLGIALRLGGAAVALVAVVWIFAAVKDLGRQEERAERAAVVQRKLQNATIADDDNTRCLADPRCRLSDDGYRRD
jgi:alpha-D-ribose 1-methylphosphonate 5-triphosphate synthase subunit PhnG